jgi:acetoin utilization deacetylase AcuC-like enzyme
MDFAAIGGQISGLGLPTLFVMEGGYALASLGDSVLSVLLGFNTGHGQ